MKMHKGKILKGLLGSILAGGVITTSTLGCVGFAKSLSMENDIEIRIVDFENFSKIKAGEMRNREEHMEEIEQKVENDKLLLQSQLREAIRNFTHIELSLLGAISKLKEQALEPKVEKLTNCLKQFSKAYVTANGGFEALKTAATNLETCVNPFLKEG